MAGYTATAKRTDWWTPPELVERVRAVFGGAIGLDPCGSPGSAVKAIREYYLPSENGLALDWNYPSVFVNPPYGRGIAAWVQKCVEVAHGVEVILLLPAATGTKHWQDAIFPTASAINFIRGRLKFVGAADDAPMPCALVYWGRDVERFAKVMCAVGVTINLNRGGA